MSSCAWLTTTNVPMMAMNGAAIQAHSIAAERLEYEPIQRHQDDQINGQAEDDETGVGHFDAGRLAERLAGGVGGGAEIVPGADAARGAGRRLILAEHFMLADG